MSMLQVYFQNFGWNLAAKDVNKSPYLVSVMTYEQYHSLSK